MAISNRSIKVTEDTHLHVSISGNNTTNRTALIFLHFWGGSSRTWSKVTQLLSLAGHQTIAIDFRGWGSSTGPTDPAAYSIQKLANDVEVVIRELSIEKYVLIGHSMGGKVAQLLAGQKKVPGLKGVVLVAPAPPGPLVLPEEAREQQLHAYETTESAEFVARNVLTASQLPEEDLDLLVQDMTKGTPEAKAAWPAYGMTEDIRDVARKIDVPVFVVGAAKDQVETVERVKSEVLSNITGAQLEVIQQSGHLIPVEAPKDLAGLIVKFLATIKDE
jgi:3-oxoadipate enol-lactonase